ncbi:hypothetical protein MHYP_G00359780 [Metynnis hypsauchen]
MTGGRRAIDSLEAEAERRSSVLIVFGLMMHIDQLEPGNKQVSTATLTHSYSIEQTWNRFWGRNRISGTKDNETRDWSGTDTGTGEGTEAGTEDWSGTRIGAWTDAGFEDWSGTWTGDWTDREEKVCRQTKDEEAEGSIKKDEIQKDGGMFVAAVLWLPERCQGRVG